MKIKAEYSIVGLVARVKLPCGCYALAACGRECRIVMQDTGQLTRIPVHVCPQWKRHKYELSRLENELTHKVRAYWRRKFKNIRFAA